MTEAELELVRERMRVVALELIVSCALKCLLPGSQGADQFRLGLSQMKMEPEPTPGTDPALSDMLGSEFRDQLVLAVDQTIAALESGDCSQLLSFG